MQRIPVVSSNLQSVGYDPTAQLLEVEFHDGSVYQYTHVPEAIYRALVAAGSHGQYFHAHIKGAYPTTRIR